MANPDRRELKRAAAAAMRAEADRDRGRNHGTLLNPTTILVLLVGLGVLLLLAAVAGLIYLLYHAAQSTPLQNDLAFAQVQLW